MNDSSDSVISMGQLAEKHFKGEFCCAEAILKAAKDTFGLDVQDSMIRSASGFCGGMGNREGPCGVFSGGIMVLGILAEQSDNGKSNELSKDLATLYTERLKSEAQGIICKDLLKNMGMFNWNKRGCRKLTRKGAEILAHIIEEKNLATRS